MTEYTKQSLDKVCVGYGLYPALCIHVPSFYLICVQFFSTFLGDGSGNPITSLSPAELSMVGYSITGYSMPGVSMSEFSMTGYSMVGYSMFSLASEGSATTF